MKKYILALLPVVGLNAQVTIGEPNGNTSAMLNITMPNSVIVLPVGDINSVGISNSSARQTAVEVPEGSLMYHRKTNSSNLNDVSGVYFRVADTQNSLNENGLSSNLTWKPFSKRKKTYVYNNVKKNINETVLGYTSGNFNGDHLNTANCFKWENDENNSQPMANNHVYCLIDNVEHGVIANDDRINGTACTEPTRISVNQPNEEIYVFESLSNFSNIGTEIIDGVNHRVFWANASGKKYNRTNVKIVTNNFELQNNWGCGYATSMIEGGYLATITSQEEYNRILDGFQEKNIPSANVGIGLRSIVNNEGDRTTYSSNASVLANSVWINGEKNSVNWMGLISNQSTNTPLTTSTTSVEKYKKSLTWTEVFRSFSGTAVLNYNRYKLAIPCSLLSGNCNYSTDRIRNNMNQIKLITKSPNEDLGTASAATSKEQVLDRELDTSNCGALIYTGNANTSGIVMDRCSTKPYPKILVEYNNN